jgi:hypothetical protein
LPLLGNGASGHRGKRAEARPLILQHRVLLNGLCPALGVSQRHPKSGLRFGVEWVGFEAEVMRAR